jgi:hypothetical protein
MSLTDMSRRNAERRLAQESPPSTSFTPTKVTGGSAYCTYPRCLAEGCNEQCANSAVPCGVQEVPRG